MPSSKSPALAGNGNAATAAIPASIRQKSRRA
jgi:hypothetical protein